MLCFWNVLALYLCSFLVGIGIREGSIKPPPGLSSSESAISIKASMNPKSIAIAGSSSAMRSNDCYIDYAKSSKIGSKKRMLCKGLGFFATKGSKTSAV